MNKKILVQTENYYTDKLRKFGRTSKGVDWNSEESQLLRFEQITKLLDKELLLNEISLCDYGCGYGSYARYLKNQGFNISYTGLDVSEEMISAAGKENESIDNTTFLCGSEFDKKYDYIVASGIFNVRHDISDDEWEEYMIEIIEKFNSYSNRGFAFNCLTKYSDKEYMKDYLYYSDPLFFFDYAKTHFSRNVALLHDYGLYEYTLIVRK